MSRSVHAPSAASCTGSWSWASALTNSGHVFAACVGQPSARRPRQRSARVRSFGCGAASAGRKMACACTSISCWASRTPGARMSSSASLRHRAIRTTASSSGVPRGAGSACSSCCSSAASFLRPAAASKSSSSTLALTSACSASSRASTHMRRCSALSRSSAPAGSSSTDPSAPSSGSSTSEMSSCINRPNRSPSPTHTASSAPTSGGSSSSPTLRSFSRPLSSTSSSARPCSLAMSRRGEMRSSWTSEKVAATGTAPSSPCGVGTRHTPTARCRASQ
mmetsp:Transcript_657/g.1943  ORF Transcript_657/g.1943 Transcript_657/m.1943 type:complete len:278 (-) Transcript_657:1140-1973(-)